MKHIGAIFLILSICFQVFPQQWDELGDNKTTGRLGLGLINPIGRLHILQSGTNWHDGIRLALSTHHWDILTEANGQRLIIAGDQNTNNGIALQNGNFGISTVAPLTKLHITQNGGNWDDGIRIGLLSHSWDIVSDANGERLVISRDQNTAQGLSIYNGKVGIGMANPDYKLDVFGTVHAKEVKVDLNFPPQDIVFESDYNLPTLQEVKKFITKNKHLPEIPSGAEMEENGIDLSVMNMKLLKKIEELTLYQIELLEKVEAYGQEMEHVKKELQKLSK